MSRRLARELALKILYRYEEGDKDLEGVTQMVLDQKQYKEEDMIFCRRLVKDTVEHQDAIDQRITQVLENWPYDRVSLIDKIVLRMGACEILFYGDIPPQVSINEAIEIVKKYGGDNSGRFVNGILDAVKKSYESSNNK